MTVATVNQKPHLAPAPSNPSPSSVVAAELAAAEAKLLSLLESHESLITEICHYLVDGGGKRLRPLFMLLVYRACGGEDRTVDDAIDAAIALELIHSATLLHDDIIDGGLVRRGRPSAFARYGAMPTLVAGDYLFCRAFELCGRFEEPLVRTAAQACLELTEGEMMEGRMRFSTTTTLDDYVAIITRKTASLFAAAGKVAAGLTAAPGSVAEAMAGLGNAVGLAFQMVDDLLDILGTEDKIGKPVGSDLRSGIPALPLVLAMESAEVRGALQNGSRLEGGTFDAILRVLRSPQIVARARSLAAEQVAIARGILTTLRPSPYRDSLGTLIDEQVNREV